MNTENQEQRRRKYKRYDEAFKRNAVDLWLQGGKSVEQIARDLGVSVNTVNLWEMGRRFPSGKNIEALAYAAANLDDKVIELATAG